jgi:peptide/nickel transport system ATP-binding protein/oligopeptide transport system ATP-binding protein
MAQRVMIAIATILRPRIIIADEPTSALDVTVQASILHELDGLRTGLGAAILLITHDLGVVARMADEVAIMYAGRVVEQGPAAEIFEAPKHPYTSALMAALPRHDASRTGELRMIRGSPPDLGALTGECAFLPRCTKAVSACRSEPWPALEWTAGRAVACYNPVYQPEREPAERA